ncbi:MAG: hypothetical protein F6K23_26415 [Okeania sp. SIO2C9]|nr:hypothetical protein [Okeania sp. SIO2C9]
MEAQDNKLSETRDLINSNARIIQALANSTAEAAEERERISQKQEQILEIIAQQQAEIRGLQTENRRILDILLNERQEDNSDES